MSSSNAPRIYWDSNVFLTYINGDPQWLPILDTLLDDASVHHTITIVTSALSIAEVAFAYTEQTGNALDPSIEAKIDGLWADRSAVTIIDTHQLIARDARTLMRKGLPNGWRLKGADAIHLATALRMRVSEIHTFEPKWHKYSPMLGIPIRAPFAPQTRIPGIP